MQGIRSMKFLERMCITCGYIWRDGCIAYGEKNVVEDRTKGGSCFHGRLVGVECVRGLDFCCDRFCWGVIFMGCRYNVFQKDGVITQLYQSVVCSSSMQKRKKNKKVSDFYVPEINRTIIEMLI